MININLLFIKLIWNKRKISYCLWMLDCTALWLIVSLCCKWFLELNSLLCLLLSFLWLLFLLQYCINFMEIDASYISSHIFLWTIDKPSLLQLYIKKTIRLLIAYIVQFRRMPQFGLCFYLLDTNLYFSGHFLSFQLWDLWCLVPPSVL